MTYYTMELVFENGKTQPLSAKFDNLDLLKSYIKNQAIFNPVKGFETVTEILVTRHEIVEDCTIKPEDI